MRILEEQPMLCVIDISCTLLSVYKNAPTRVGAVLFACAVVDKRQNGSIGSTGELIHKIRIVVYFGGRGAVL